MVLERTNRVPTRSSISSNIIEKSLAIINIIRNHSQSFSIIREARTSFPAERCDSSNLQLFASEWVWQCVVVCRGIRIVTWILVREVQQPIPLLFAFSPSVSKNFSQDSETQAFLVLRFTSRSSQNPFAACDELQYACRGIRHCLGMGT